MTYKQTTLLGVVVSVLALTLTTGCSTASTTSSYTEFNPAISCESMSETQSSSLIIKPKQTISLLSNQNQLEDLLFELEVSGKKSLNPINTQLTTVSNKPAKKSLNGLYKISFTSREARQEAYHVLSQSDLIQSVEFDEATSVYEVNSEAGDPYRAKQWYFGHINYTLTTPDKTAKKIQVAVIDTGINLSHPDLSEAIINAGVDTYNNDNDASDDNGHGTHVAGIIGAISNNELGIKGMADVSLLPIKATCSDGTGTYSDLIEGINVAIANDADVINISMGGERHSSFLKASIEAAIENNIVVVAAAGNYNSTNDFYPAAYDGVIAVASTDKRNNKVESSNYGKWVDIAAPGNHMLSTSIDGGYVYKTGTSMAAPVVAGAVALLLQINPDLTPQEVSDILKKSSTPLTSSEAPDTASGLLNVGTALSLL